MKIKFLLLSCFLVKLSNCWDFSSNTNYETNRESYSYDDNTYENNEAIPRGTENPYFLEYEHFTTAEPFLDETLEISPEDVLDTLDYLIWSKSEAQASLDILLQSTTPRENTYEKISNNKSLSDLYWKATTQFRDILRLAQLLQYRLNFTTDLKTNKIFPNFGANSRTDLDLYYTYQLSLNENYNEIKDALQLLKSFMIDGTPTANSVIDTIDEFVEDLAENDGNFDMTKYRKKPLLDKSYNYFENYTNYVNYYNTSFYEIYYSNNSSSTENYVYNTSIYENNSITYYQEYYIEDETTTPITNGATANLFHKYGDGIMEENGNTEVELKAVATASNPSIPTGAIPNFAIATIATFNDLNEEDENADRSSFLDALNEYSKPEYMIGGLQNTIDSNHPKGNVYSTSPPVGNRTYIVDGINGLLTYDEDADTMENVDKDINSNDNSDIFTPDMLWFYDNKIDLRPIKNSNVQTTAQPDLEYEHEIDFQKLDWDEIPGVLQTVNETVQYYDYGLTSTNGYNNGLVPNNNNSFNFLCKYFGQKFCESQTTTVSSLRQKKDNSKEDSNLNQTFSNSLDSNSSIITTASTPLVPTGANPKFALINTTAFYGLNMNLTEEDENADRSNFRDALNEYSSPLYLVGGLQSTINSDHLEDGVYGSSLPMQTTAYITDRSNLNKYDTFTHKGDTEIMGDKDNNIFPIDNYDGFSPELIRLYKMVHNNKTNLSPIGKKYVKTTSHSDFVEKKNEIDYQNLFWHEIPVVANGINQSAKYHNIDLTINITYNEKVNINNSKSFNIICKYFSHKMCPSHVKTISLMSLPQTEDHEKSNHSQIFNKDFNTNSLMLIVAVCASFGFIILLGIILVASFSRKRKFVIYRPTDTIPYSTMHGEKEQYRKKEIPTHGDIRVYTINV